MTDPHLESLISRLRIVISVGSARTRVVVLTTLFLLFCCAFLIFSAADVVLKLEKEIRVGASSAALLAMMVVLLLLVRAARRARQDELRAAAQVERIFPQLESSLLASVEFGTDPVKTASLSSQEIVQALVRETARQTHSLDFSRAVDWRQPKRLLIAMALLLLLCVGYASMYPRLARLTFLRFVAPWADTPRPTLTVVTVSPAGAEVRKLKTVHVTATIEGKLPDAVLIHHATLSPEGKELEWKAEPMLPRGQTRRDYIFTFPRMIDSVRFFVEAGDDATPKYLLEVYEPPKVVRFALRLIYPAYTGMAPKLIEDAVGPLSAITGTEIEVTGIANKPIARAAIELKGRAETSLPAQLVDKTTFRAKFLLMEDGRYRLRVWDAKGRSNEDAIFYSAKALPDRAPTVAIVKPGKNQRLLKSDEIELQTKAEDDFGLAELGIAYRIKTHPERRVPLRTFQERILEASQENTMYLEEMGLADTDIVTYYAFARDNDTVSGPKEGRSQLYFVEIRPFAERYREKEEEERDGAGGEMAQKADKMIPALEKIIERQKEVLSRTFDLDRLPPGGPSEKDIQTQLVDLGSTEESLRQDVEVLEATLAGTLMAFGLREHLDRVEHLSSARNELGLANFFLTRTLSPTRALGPENSALYHLVRAKRDLIQLISKKNDMPPELRKQLEQALEIASQSIERSEQERQQQQSEELRRQASELQKMLEEQRQLNRQMQQMAAQAQREQAQQQSEHGTPQQGAPQSAQSQALQEAARKQGELADRAQERAFGLRRQDAQDKDLSFQPARDTNDAAQHMRDAEKALKQQNPSEARDHGDKAEKKLDRALREVQRTLERSLAERLKAAAAKARELAEEQRELALRTGELRRNEEGSADRQNVDESRPQRPQKKDSSPGTAPQEAEASQPPSTKETGTDARRTSPQTAHRPHKEGDGQAPFSQASQEEKSDRPSQPSSQQAERPVQASGRSPRPEAQELAKRQREVRQDLAELGRELQQLAPKVTEVNRPIGEEVAKVRDAIQGAEIQPAMRRAEELLKQHELAVAEEEQAAAQKPLNRAATRLRELAQQFDMDDNQRLAKAIERADDLKQRQMELNKALADQSPREERGETEAVPKPKATPDESALPPAERQEALERETRDLAQEAERIRALQDAGLQRQVKESLRRAADSMAESRRHILQNEPQRSVVRGQEASRELQHSAEAMRQLLKETLDQQLAKALERAREAREAQEESRQTVARAIDQQQPQFQAALPLAQAQKALREQADAKEATKRLTEQIASAQAQAQATGEKQVAESLAKEADQIAQNNLQQQMAQVLQEMQEGKWPAALAHQNQLVELLNQAHRNLQELYEDRTSLPSQRLKRAADQAKALGEKAEGLAEKAKKISDKPTHPEPAESEKLTQELERLAKEVEKFAERLQRLAAKSQEHARMQAANEEMKDLSRKLGQGQVKELAPGLNSISKALQSIGDGLIERLERLADKGQKKEPPESVAPEEYRELVRQYFQALSEK